MSRKFESGDVVYHRLDRTPVPLTVVQTEVDWFGEEILYVMDNPSEDAEPFKVYGYNVDKHEALF